MAETEEAKSEHERRASTSRTGTLSSHEGARARATTHVARPHTRIGVARWSTVGPTHEFFVRAKSSQIRHATYR
eukprot:3950406-Prymnesium_polylepis.1